MLHFDLMSKTFQGIQEGRFVCSYSRLFATQEFSLWATFYVAQSQFISVMLLWPIFALISLTCWTTRFIFIKGYNLFYSWGDVGDDK